jgi:hypothetical protein
MQRVLVVPWSIAAMWSGIAPVILTAETLSR